MSGGIVPDAAAGPAPPDSRFRRGRAAARQTKTDRIRCSTAGAVDTDRSRRFRSLPGAEHAVHRPLSERREPSNGRQCGRVVLLCPNASPLTNLPHRSCGGSNKIARWTRAKRVPPRVPKLRRQLQTLLASATTDSERANLEQPLVIIGISIINRDPYWKVPFWVVSHFNTVLGCARSLNSNED